MPEPRAVLIMTGEQTLRNLLEQLCIVYGARPLTVTTLPEAERLMARRGLGNFSLAIIDTAACASDEMQQHHSVCRLLDEWTSGEGELPLLLIGTLLQKHAVPAAQLDKVRFLVKPFRSDALVRSMHTLLGEKDWPSGLEESAQQVLASYKRSSLADRLPCDC